MFRVAFEESESVCGGKDQSAEGAEVDHNSRAKKKRNFGSR